MPNSPNEDFSFSKDARLAKTGTKILLYKLADLSLILKKKTKLKWSLQPSPLH